MDVRITTRHVDLSGSFLELADERTRRLDQFEPGLRSVDLLFDDEHGKLLTEARAGVPGRPPMIARAASEDRRKSLHATLRKLRRQLRRERVKRLEQKSSPPRVPAAD